MAVIASEINDHDGIMTDADNGNCDGVGDHGRCNRYW